MKDIKSTITTNGKGAINAIKCNIIRAESPKRMESTPSIKTAVYLVGVGCAKRYFPEGKDSPQLAWLFSRELYNLQVSCQRTGKPRKIKVT